MLLLSLSTTMLVVSDGVYDVDTDHNDKDDYDDNEDDKNKARQHSDNTTSRQYGLRVSAKSTDDRLRHTQAASTV